LNLDISVIHKQIYKVILSFLIRKKMVKIIEFDSKRYVKGFVMLTLIVFFIVIFTSAIFASFQSGNPGHSIDKIYGPLTNISGWINISFESESIDSFFNASFDEESEVLISLQELLNKNPAYKNSCICTPLDCEGGYSSTNGTSSKIFGLNLDDPKVFGLTLIGNLIEINSASFSLQSNASTACVNQIEIDIFDDGNIDFINNKIAVGNSCSNLKTYGCYNALENNEEYTITSKPYCQKINLSESPGFYLGAWVKNVTGSLDLKMSLYDNYGIVPEGADCALPEITSSEGEVLSCSIDYPVSESREYSVCISSTGGTGEYRIRGNSNPSEGCGFYGYPPPSNTPAAYEIFAEGRKFDSVGEIEIPNTLPNGGTFGDLIQDYILDKYGSLDCLTECVIPIRFISGIDQEITINNLALNYEKTTGIVKDNKFYDLTEIPAKISCGYKRLFLDKAGFSVPSELDNYSFSLKLNNEEIFSENIEVKDVPIIKTLKPRLTAAGFTETFIVEVENANITNYNWDFGDNSTITTPINKTLHIYPAIGTYNLKISVTDTRGFSSSRIFEINVSSPKNRIQGSLNKMNADLQNLKTDIQNQGLFQQIGLNSVLKIQNITSELERLEQEYNAATNESEYLRIVGNLNEIRLPENIFKTKEANSFLFFPEKEYIDMDIVESIGGGEYESRKTENYKNAVLAWQLENIDMKIDFAEFSGEYDSNIDGSSIEPLISIFEIRITEKEDIVHDYYLIIPKLQNIGFNKNFDEKDGFVYVNLKGISGVNFYTTEDIDFSDLPAFIAPPINRLVVSDIIIPSEKSKKQKLIIFILSMISLIVIGIVAYVIIYHWYKRKYEKYLFKNRNDLYNMVTYVDNSKKKGLDNRKIIRNLKKAGWSSEQTRYVMRKYKGKRTGMAKLPLRLAKKVKKDRYAPLK